MTDMNALRDWRFSIDTQGIAWAVFDREGESQNSLSRRALEELGAVVERVEQGARDTGRPYPEVHIRADKDVRFQAVGRVVLACQIAGIMKVGFLTEPHNDQAQ